MADVLTITPTAPRVTFARTNAGPFTIDMGTVGGLDVNSLGGEDSITAAAGLAPLILLDLDGGTGNDTIVGAEGIDTISGDDGNDKISGFAGADMIKGGDGNDTITGGPGDDSVNGEGGSDVLIWNDGDGSDLLEGGEGVDGVQVNGSAPPRCSRSVPTDRGLRSPVPTSGRSPSTSGPWSSSPSPQVTARTR